MKPKTTRQYLNLLNETIAYYSEDVSRRSIDSDNSCYYTHPETGNHCAVGRCLVKASRKLIVRSEDLNDQDVESLFENSKYKLYKRYEGFKLRFWEHLQELHDGCGNWCSTGLSDHGDLKVACIINTIEEWEERGEL